MAVSCAKPGCTHRAVAWFALSRTDLVVEIVDAPTEGFTALCARHLDRFSAPEGWRVEHRSVVSVGTGPRREPEAATAEVRRGNRPWFADVDAPSAPVEVDGGLLGRAFNGPQRLR